MYKISNEYYVRIHHVRPRFKSDLENVLIYMATEIAKLPELPDKEFSDKVNNAVRLFPGNTTATEKTVNNWRTEISALFGFIEHKGKISKCGRRAKELSDSGDLVSFFKTFLFNFQYPGAHIKAKTISELVELGVKFKPAKYILSLLQGAEKKTGKRQKITKAEVCWCVFSDLRVVRDNDDVLITWERICSNREAEIEYDTSGDVIRYASDIVDYMVMANLLVTYDGKNFYINNRENEAIAKFVNSEEWFLDYNCLITEQNDTYDSINACYDDWFSYVNRDMADTDFTTDILAFTVDDSANDVELKQSARNLAKQLLENKNTALTKEIGDLGEGLIHSHECERVRIGERCDLVHLIKRMPTSLAVGYDIQSVDLDERKRYIEVKTTISSKPIQFNRVHLTTNEWVAADTLKEHYFIYRLMISKSEYKLYLIQDPVGKYKANVIQMVPRDGADITFNPDISGTYEELLSWRS